MAKAPVNNKARKAMDEQIEAAQIAVLKDNFIDFTDSAVLKRVKADLKAAATNVSREEVKILVNMYYKFQMDRIRNANRVTAFTANKLQPVLILDYFSGHFENLEKLMITPLQTYVENHPVGGWLIDRKGIGPVLAAGLLAHLIVKREVPVEGTDYKRIETFPYVSKWWRFGGFDPTLVWNKGEKRPYNAALKTLYYKCGKSIVMTGKGEIYRELYDRRKEYATLKNENGGYAETARNILQRISKNKLATIEDQEIDGSLDTENGEDNIEEDKSAYIKLLQQGKISKAAIDAQSRRWMVQMFLSHLHTVMWETVMKTPVAKPYALAHLSPDQHHEFIPVPDYIPLVERNDLMVCPPNGIIRKVKKAPIKIKSGK